MSRTGDLTNAMANTLADIPELLAELAPIDPIIAYVDQNPLSNDVERAIYGMQPGQLLVVTTGTERDDTGTMSRYAHLIEVCIRALPDRSEQELIDLIMTGVPASSDCGLVWYYCPLLPGLLGADLVRWERRKLSEGIDYLVMLWQVPESAGWPPRVSRQQRHFLEETK
jgi:hypothetical protein